MKKWLGAALPIAFIVLTACSSTSEPTEGTVNTSDVTLEEVYNEAMARQAELKSVTANVVADQKITFGTGEQMMEMLSTTVMKMDTQMEPLALFADGTIAMETNGETIDMPMQLYMTETDGLFVQDGAADTWMRLPTEMTDQMLDQLGTHGNAAEQLAQLQAYVSDFTFEQTDTDYLLTLVADDEKFNELILASAGTALEEMTAEEQQVLDTMTFEDAVYTLTIDKKTYDTKKVDMDFVMKMDMDGQQSVIDTTSTVTFSNFNAVEPITIPQSVIDEAVESQ